MGISLNSVANGVKNVTSATLATGQPNWSYIPSAAKQTKTQTEFITEIKELARNAATVTNKADKDSIDRQLLQLRAEYLSDVSPDRKSLYQSAKNAIQKSSNTNPKCRGIGGAGRIGGECRETARCEITAGCFCLLLTKKMQARSRCAATVSTNFTM